jgi:uncharacterized protein YaaQ
MSVPTTLVLLIVQPEDSAALLTRLTDAGLGATSVSARGGFLQRHAVAILVAAPAARVPTVLEAVRATCAKRTAWATLAADAELGITAEPIEVEIGGAIVFGLPASFVAHWGVLVTRPPAFPNTSLIWSATPVIGDAPARQEAPMPATDPTTLIIAVVPDRAVERVIAALVEHRYGATTIGSSGGFLRRGNTTILTGVPTEQAVAVAHLMQAACQAAGGPDHPDGGIAFALEANWYLRL